jgi:histidinol dehydrogenase
MLAYGSAAGAEPGPDDCAPVDVITGPGNVWVTAAKRLVQGRCGIDSEAGPTEIGILADDTAVPAFVAADLVAQAEHDPLAACLLVTPSEALLDAVDAELATQVPAARHRERVETALTGQSAFVLVDDLDHGLEVVDHWAAEHLEVVTADAPERARRVRNAGAVFIGNSTPVSLGDYLAGSNHVLPTGGTARFSSGLSAQSFLKRMSLVEYSADALSAVTPHVTALGGAEELASHVEAVQVRSRGAAR